jgi:hypothetical protein
VNAQWHHHLESLGNKRDHGLRNVQGSEPEKVEILNDDLWVNTAEEFLHFSSRYKDEVPSR